MKTEFGLGCQFFFCYAIDQFDFRIIVNTMYFLPIFFRKIITNHVLLITNVVPLLLGTFAETCSLNLPQKGRKAGHDCLWAVA